jgi:PAS domain S-box-containing protein
MAKKPTYKELEQRIKALEKEAVELRQSEQALRKTDGDMYSLLNELRDGFFITNSKGTITFVNKALGDMGGYENPEEIIGKHFLEYLPSEAREEIIEKFNRAIENKDYSELLEFPAVKKDGSIALFQLKHCPVMEDNRIIGTMGVVRDITARRWAEDALRESEERYRSLFDDNHSVILLIDAENADIVDANPAACSFYGFSKKDLTSKKITDINLLPKEQVFRQMKGLKSQPRRHFFFPHRLANGEVRKVEAYTGPIRLNGRRLFYSMIYDITERVRTDEALRESEKRYRLLVETMNDGLAVLNEENLFTYVNDKFCEMLGYPKNDVVGHPVTDFLDETNQSIIIRQLTRRQRAERGFYELTWNNKHGRQTPAIMSASPIVDTDGRYKGSFSVITNITELKQAEQALKKREKELEIKTSILKETNTALNVLLKRRDQDKAELEERVLLNMRELVAPYFEKLKRSGLDDRQMAYAEILESNLNDIISPFTRTLSSKYLSLTPTEIQVANLIKQGKSTKEIADFLNISSSTICFHRENVREKIGIKNKKANLRTHLQSFY